MNRIFWKIAHAKLDRYAEAVIYRLRRIRSEQFQPDEYPTRNVRDLWKLEIQEEQSVAFELLGELIEGMALKYIETLPWDEVAFLAEVLDGPRDEDELGDDFDIVSRELCSVIDSRASNEPHRREVQAMLDGVTLDRFERDTEAY